MTPTSIRSYAASKPPSFRPGSLALVQYVPLSDPIKVSRLTIRNLSGVPHRLSVTAYAEWVLGTSRGASGPFITTEIDATTGAMLARNPWSIAFPGRVAFIDLGGRQTAWTADRTEFLGRNGGPATPLALVGKRPLSGKTGAGFDPCAALQSVVELGAGDTVELVSFVEQCGSAAEARALIARYRETDLEAVLEDMAGYWDALLGTVQVKTPDRAMDIMLNGWLLYQTLACRIWARSAFLPGKRCLRLPRPASGRHGVDVCQARRNTAPPSACRCPAVRRRGRSALVAAALRAAGTNADLGRPRLAGICDC